MEISGHFPLNKRDPVTVSPDVKPPAHESSHPHPAEKVLIRGIGLEITPALRTAVIAKASRLLRHGARIIRVRIDLERDGVNDPLNPAIAHGRVEIRGPDLIARVASETVGKSLDLLIDKLDRMARELGKYRANRRNDRPPGAEFRDFLATPDSPM